MRYLYTLVLIFVSIDLLSQSGRDKADQLEGQYHVDDNGYVTYSEVLAAPGVSADELYTRALNYFTYNYKDANSVIQTEDPENHTIVAKGLYASVYVYNIGVDDIMTYHIIRIDTKEDRARVIISLTGYKSYTSGTQYAVGGWNDISISQMYPINKSSWMKNFYGHVFFNSHMKVMGSFSDINKVLNEGNTNVEADDDW